MMTSSQLKKQEPNASVDKTSVPTLTVSSIISTKENSTESEIVPSSAAPTPHTPRAHNKTNSPADSSLPRSLSLSEHHNQMEDKFFKSDKDFSFIEKSNISNADQTDIERYPGSEYFYSNVRHAIRLRVIKVLLTK